MSKITTKLFLFLFLIIILWLQIFTKIAFAEQVFNVSKYGVKFTVKHDPERLYTDSSSVTITVTVDRDFFNSGASYAHKFQATKNPGCFFDSDIIRAKPKDATTYEATLKLGLGCTASPDEWTFSLAQVERGTTNKEVLVSGYKFIIEQTGGQLPSIKPLDDPLSVGTKPSVVLINPRTDNNYEFWWAGARKSFATEKHPITATSNNNIIIPLKEEEVSFNGIGEKILCMEVKKKGESDSVPWGISCSYQTTFHYQFNMAPPSTKCSLEPSANASRVDSISMRITYASSNTDIEGYLMQEANKINPNTAKTDDNGNALISLGNALPIGIYTTRILNSSTQQSICSDQQLTIGEGGITGAISVPAPTPCTDPAKCTTGGGKEVPGCTDVKDHPAIATAIGCIHTNPVEFVKDLLTWVIGIGGGIAFLMMLLGAFQMLTSAGNPETLQAGRDRLTSAVIGLLFIIFSVLLMQIIGWDILHLEGFGR